MKPTKKQAEKTKDSKSSLAEQLMNDYDKKKEGEIDRQGLAELLQDAYRLSNKRLHVSKEDLNTLMSLLDKDGDGRITISDLESSIGKIMLKKQKEEEERKLELKKRDEERKMMKSPLRNMSPKPVAKSKDKHPGKAIETPSDHKAATPSKAEPKEKKDKPSKKDKEEKEEKPKKDKDKSSEKPKKDEKKKSKK
jgi:hypothetical protein